MCQREEENSDCSLILWGSVFQLCSYLCAELTEIHASNPLTPPTGCCLSPLLPVTAVRIWSLILFCHNCQLAVTSLKPEEEKIPGWSPQPRDVKGPFCLHLNGPSLQGSICARAHQDGAPASLGLAVRSPGTFGLGSS